MKREGESMNVGLVVMKKETKWPYGGEKRRRGTGHPRKDTGKGMQVRDRAIGWWCPIG